MQPVSDVARIVNDAEDPAACVTLDRAAADLRFSRVLNRLRGSSPPCPSVKHWLSPLEDEQGARTAGCALSQVELLRRSCGREGDVRRLSRQVGNDEDIGRSSPGGSLRGDRHVELDPRRVLECPVEARRIDPRAVHRAE